MGAKPQTVEFLVLTVFHHQVVVALVLFSALAQMVVLVAVVAHEIVEHLCMRVELALLDKETLVVLVVGHLLEGLEAVEVVLGLSEVMRVQALAVMAVMVPHRQSLAHQSLMLEVAAAWA